MRLLRAGAAALCVAALTTACSDSGGSGDSGGYRVTSVGFPSSLSVQSCNSPGPALDTFSSTPSPDPNCTPSQRYGLSTPAPDTSARPQRWQNVRVMSFGGSSSSGSAPSASSSSANWRTIYTTYTAPPDPNIYQPMVQKTNQPMPTPYTTPTPLPTPATIIAQPSSTP